mmetsp:Transcript_35635/g.40055  ORF Transcript_35635/g.40055 Transcript_35635/m.40055 type:complete len:1419 (-) Transcript_35635:1224-5480(-)
MERVRVTSLPPTIDPEGGTVSIRPNQLHPREQQEASRTDNNNNNSNSISNNNNIDDDHCDGDDDTKEFFKNNNSNNLHNSIYDPKSVENAPEHDNFVGMKMVAQAQRSLSETSFGSFSMDEEESDFGESTTGTNNNIGANEMQQKMAADVSAANASVGVTQQLEIIQTSDNINSKNDDNYGNASSNIVNQKVILGENPDGQDQQVKAFETTIYHQHEDQNQNQLKQASPIPPLLSTTNGSNDTVGQHPNVTVTVNNNNYEQQQKSKISHRVTETRHSEDEKKCYDQKQQEESNDINDVIVLLDDEEGDTDVQIINNQKMVPSAGVKRMRPSEVSNHKPQSVILGSTMYGYQSQTPNYNYGRNQHSTHIQSGQKRMQQQNNFKPNQASEPQYIDISPKHTPTWDNPLPPIPKLSQNPTHRSNQLKHFELSLLNVSEFTITGLPVTLDGQPSSVLGFRKSIKEVSRGHGKAVFQRDNIKGQNNNTNNNNNYSSYSMNNNENKTSEYLDGGKWRIPLGAYRAFYSYLKSDSLCKVSGISEDQLKIASLGRARLEKGFPSANKIMSLGVPKGLASALAPFQRGGVDFIVEKRGRALLADDMGLGKTIQAIASMSVFHDEWPLLILTPSSARYHWENEFQQWLGSGSTINDKKKGGRKYDSITTGSEEEKEDLCKEKDSFIQHTRKSMRLLRDSEIHVVITGKAKLFPNKNTRIVICSYGLATSLIESGKIYVGLFKCAIVDESHMLKNIKTKRTSKLVPILHSTNRCILLSGTPALAHPTELWPQLKILSTVRDGWWDDENDFIRKYVQRTSATRRAELHTMLTGTVMIRRMKHNILKSLPSKRREKAIVNVVTKNMRGDFHKFMKLLREGNGVFAKIAKKRERAVSMNSLVETEKDTYESLKAEYNERYRDRLHSLSTGMLTSPLMNDEEKKYKLERARNQAKAEVDVWYRDRAHELQNGLQEPDDEKLDRKTILNRMYSLTAKAKIPYIAELVEKWLADPTKGKLCIFAHHIFVLDELIKLAGLSNKQGSNKHFIRIDGSTPPKERQSQIKCFQTDPSIRCAVLGITAAGVAVTLTASSTVWFAELFWTPALMIQAEDRCHRIGQNAVVKCLYFVATGTLDVLLWDLLEKKFQDLGEFVEGKEKMKIVVHHTYKSIGEVESIFSRFYDDDHDDDVKFGDNETAAEGDDLIKLENDLQEDIVQLANEEMVMISQEEDEYGTDSRTRKFASLENFAQNKSDLGQTEDEAICLSDEDDNEISSNHKVGTKTDSSPTVTKENNGSINYKDMSRVLLKVRYYNQYFDGSSFGIQLLVVNKRLVVANKMRGRAKPALGDVLVAVNGYRLPLDCPLNEACRYMKSFLNRGTVELTFVVDDGFLKFCVLPIVQARQQVQAANNSVNPEERRNGPPTCGGVIEILDDDD